MFARELVVCFVFGVRHEIVRKIFRFSMCTVCISEGL